MLPSTRHARIAALVLIVGSACSTRATAGSRSATGPARSILVRVENAAFSDVRVHAVMNGANELRLGSVGSMATRTLAVPPAMSAAGSIRLVAFPLAGGDPHYTDVLRVLPGDTIVWQIGNESRLSRFFVR